jgi:ornithine cyclodeaminase
MSQETRYFSATEVSQVLTPGLAYDAVRDALLCHAGGVYQMPLKPYLYPQGRDRVNEGGRVIVMPALLGAPFNAIGLKDIAGFPRNRRRGLPRAQAVILLRNYDTGWLEAVMDGTQISAARTGAVAALSHDHLGPGDGGPLAVLGAGPVAAATIEALQHVAAPPRAIRVFDLERDRARDLTATLRQGGRPDVEAVESAEQCVRGAAVVVTATTATGAYVSDTWLTACRLVIALSFEDCEPAVLLSSKLVVDDWAHCCREQKPIHRLTLAGQLSSCDLHAQLSDIVIGRRPGRSRSDERFYVNPMGLAIEDIAVAARVRAAAIERGLGLVLPA